VFGVYTCRCAEREGSVECLQTGGCQISFIFSGAFVCPGSSSLLSSTVRRAKPTIERPDISPAGRIGALRKSGDARRRSHAEEFSRRGFSLSLNSSLASLPSSAVVAVSCLSLAATPSSRLINDRRVPGSSGRSARIRAKQRALPLIRRFAKQRRPWKGRSIADRFAERERRVVALEQSLNGKENRPQTRPLRT